MEVHAHTHPDPAHGGTGRKKFTHYLWEFLMLFLAVLCGFLAENFKENQLEKNKAQQYIHSLYEDLKTDNVKINEMLLYDDDKIDVLNNMDACYDSVSKNPLS